MKVFKLTALMERILLVPDDTDDMDLWNRVSDITEPYDLEGFDLTCEEMPFEEFEAPKVIH